MNKKLYFNLVFFITGTLVVLVMAAIIGMNFVKDSRLLANAAMNENSSSQSEPVKAKKNESSNNENTSGTFVYKREPTPTPKPNSTTTPNPNLPSLEPGLKLPDLETGVSKTQNSQTASPDAAKGSGGEATPSPGSGAATSTDKIIEPTPNSQITNKIRIEVVNCSGKKDLAEVVRKKLEDQGFEVSAGNVDKLNEVKTEIIFRNDNIEAQKVRNYISTQRISKQIDPNSKYDVTIIIGDDYTP